MSRMCNCSTISRPVIWRDLGVTQPGGVQASDRRPRLITTVSGGQDICDDPSEFGCQFDLPRVVLTPTNVDDYGPFKADAQIRTGDPFISTVTHYCAWRLPFSNGNTHGSKPTPAGPRRRERNVKSVSAEACFSVASAGDGLHIAGRIDRSSRPGAQSVNAGERSGPDASAYSR